MKTYALAALIVAACGGGGNNPPAVDAPMQSSNKVVAVTCPTTADGMVTSSNTASSYTPATQTVPVNAVVKFVMPSAHNVAPNTLTTTDPGLSVGFGETKCLKFTQAGTFGFFCTAHSFTGTITVQ